MTSLKSQQFAPQLVIFDKGGTLIDFFQVWRPWVVELARRLESVTGLALADGFFGAVGFEPMSGHIDHQGRLATKTMSGLRAWTAAWLCQVGLSRQAAEQAIRQAGPFPPPPGGGAGQYTIYGTAIFID